MQRAKGSGEGRAKAIRHDELRRPEFSPVSRRWASSSGPSSVGMDKWVQREGRSHTQAMGKGYQGKGTRRSSCILRVSRGF